MEMPEYLVLLSTKNFLNFSPDEIFEFEFTDMAIKIRQIRDSLDKVISSLNNGCLMEVKLSEKDIDSAIEKAFEVSEFFLSIICLDTGLPSHSSKIVLAYEISENVEERIFRQYFPDIPFSIKSAEIERDGFFDNVKTIYQYVHGPEKIKYKHRVYRAMRWFRKGLSSHDPLDQFLFFWHGLETINPILAEYFNSKNVLKGKTTRKCNICGNEYEDEITLLGGIELLYDNIGLDETYKKEIKKIRNGISHGFEDIYPLSKRAYEMIPLMAQLLFYGLSKVIGVPYNLKIHENLKRVNPIKDNDFLYIEGFIIEKELSKIGENNYYPHFKMEISNNQFTHHSFIGCNFRSKKIFTSCTNLMTEINE